MIPKPVDVLENVKSHQACYLVCLVSSGCQFSVFRKDISECEKYAEEPTGNYYECDLVRGPNSPVYDSNVSKNIISSNKLFASIIQSHFVYLLGLWSIA